MDNLLLSTNEETVKKALDWMKTNLDEGFYENEEFKVGDQISFYGGYHGDIHYSSKIIGIDTNGWLYLIWDCYWFPIDPKDSARKVVKLNSVTTE